MRLDNKQKLLICLCFAFNLFNSANAVCRPRNFTYPSPYPSPSPTNETPEASDQPSQSPTPEASDEESQKNSGPVAPDQQSQSTAPEGPDGQLPNAGPEAPDQASQSSTSSRSAEIGMPSVTDLFSHIEASIASIQANHALKSVCDQTDYSAVCMSTLTPYFNGKTDAVSMLETAIKACSEHTKLGIEAAVKVSVVPSDTMMTNNIRDCKEMYEDALDNLKSAEEAIPSHDMGTITSMLSAVLTDYETCEDVFAGEPNLLFSAIDDRLSKLASNCLAIASLMK